MKSLIVYDSTFGNTKKIAAIIAEEIGKDAKALSVSEFKSMDLKDTGLIVAGSPIIGWRPSENMGIFLESLKKDQLKGIKAASFDTRINVFFHGDATKQISQGLKDAGAEIISEPKFFFVKGKEGPLADGEIEKAKKWAKSLIE